MATDFSFARNLIDEIDGWVNELAAHLMPPRIINTGQGMSRLELRKHTPHTVMIGKCVRAASGIRAALTLADLGYVVECAALLRVVSDFCTEIMAISSALNRKGELPRTVQTFVEQYFAPIPKTPEELEAADRARYVSREKLLKEVGGFLAANANVDSKQSLPVLRFLNMIYDKYVHGAYETTMELCDPDTSRFMMRGHPSQSKRQEFAEAVFLKLHEVVIAIEHTAAVTGQTKIFEAVRNARRTMDSSIALPTTKPH